MHHARTTALLGLPLTSSVSCWQIWRKKAKMLYQMKRMKEAFECCQEAFELLPGDEELEDLLWDIGERM